MQFLLNISTSKSHHSCLFLSWPMRHYSADDIDGVRAASLERGLLEPQYTGECSTLHGSAIIGYRHPSVNDRSGAETRGTSPEIKMLDVFEKLSVILLALAIHSTCN
ncbi:hypothetical protein H4Q26_015663 [Puccinia striiformis f. sp. tritici PST-130]|nr:hypothetical protein H4Q26_015663 [Puccinia striiformis f. sp. tritici PST-130]